MTTPKEAHAILGAQPPAQRAWGAQPPIGHPVDIEYDINTFNKSFDNATALQNLLRCVSQLAHTTLGASVDSDAVVEKNGYHDKQIFRSSDRETNLLNSRNYIQCAAC